MPVIMRSLWHNCCYNTFIYSHVTSTFPETSDFPKTNNFFPFSKFSLIITTNFSAFLFMWKYVT